jgi:hypothetical protein
MKRKARWVIRIKPFLAATLAASLFAFDGCLDSDIAKRFREAYAPGFISGLSTAVGTPGQAETGLRQMGTALAEGLGAILQPRTASSSSNTP